MRIPRIFTPQALSEHSIIDLDERAANHCHNVLRLRKGFVVHLFNGSGGEYEGSITQVSRKLVQVQLSRFINVDHEPALKIHLALGISRGDRMDIAIQKAVELGVESISPLMMERCVVRIDDNNREKRMTHWRGVIISASEQSGRTMIPSLSVPRSLSDWLNDAQPQMRFAFVPGADTRLRDYREPGVQISLLVGPEGGFGDDELSKITASDLTCVHLGPRILRTETATITAVALAQALWGDL